MIVLPCPSRAIRSPLLAVLLVAALPSSFVFAESAAAQTVAMSGEYGASDGRILNVPLNPPRTVCTQAQNARCHPGSIAFNGDDPTFDPLAAASSGVAVPGAGVRIISGGLGVGDPFTIPPGAFQQDRGNQFTPIVGSPFLVQLDTTFSHSMPAAARAVNPPASTRVFQPNGWSAPGNGQAGRAAASTTPISGGTQTVHDITLRYKAGPNAFGGTMASLQDGEGRIYLEGPIQVSTGGGTNTSTHPWIGTNQFGDGIPNNPETRFGAGWDYTRMGAQAAGVIRNLGGIAPDCTVATPPGPAGCGLVTDFTGFTIGTIPAVTSTRFLFAWTTGTVEVISSGTVGGFPAEQLLTAMGYDSTSMTMSGATIRNIGLVAGSYTLRTSLGGPSRGGNQVIGLDMRFTPEPQRTAMLVIGLGLLALLSGRVKEPGRGQARH